MKNELCWNVCLVFQAYSIFFDTNSNIYYFLLFAITGIIQLFSPPIPFQCPNFLAILVGFRPTQKIPFSPLFTTKQQPHIICRASPLPRPAFQLPLLLRGELGRPCRPENSRPRKKIMHANFMWPTAMQRSGKWCVAVDSKR